MCCISNTGFLFTCFVSWTNRINLLPEKGNKTSFVLPLVRAAEQIKPWISVLSNVKGSLKDGNETVSYLSGRSECKIIEEMSPLLNLLESPLVSVAEFSFSPRGVG